MRAINKLSARKVDTLSKPGLYGDGLGLYLQVSTFGTKSWLYRYMIDGKARKMGLGPCHTVTLAMAREKATEARRKVLEGIDPIDQRQAVKLARRADAAKVMTFRQCAEKYIDAHKVGWKNPKHAAQWPSTLETYVYPVFGDLPVASVDVDLVQKAIEPIWTTKSETAGRVRGRIETVLDWATACKYREGDNPARWGGNLKYRLPKPSSVAKVKHHAALPYAEIGDFMPLIRAQEGNGARALEFVILTAVRTSEAINATWAEFDLDAGMWTIPAERMKAGKEHRVPLSNRAVELLRAMPRETGNPFVFIGDRKGKPLSNMALLMTLRRMGRDDLTVHGFRSTFRDWAAEQTAYANEMLEMALAHAVSDKTEAAYRRGDMVEKRRRLMRDWAEYCSKPAAKGNVVPMRGVS